VTRAKRQHRQNLNHRRRLFNIQRPKLKWPRQKRTNDTSSANGDDRNNNNNINNSASPNTIENVNANANEPDGESVNTNESSWRDDGPCHHVWKLETDYQALFSMGRSLLSFRHSRKEYINRHRSKRHKESEENEGRHNSHDHNDDDDDDDGDGGKHRKDDNNHNDDDTFDSKSISMEDGVGINDSAIIMGVTVDISRCCIKSVNLAPFVGVAGLMNDRCRTFLLALSLRNTEFRCRLGFTIKDDGDGDGDGGKKRGNSVSNNEYHEDEGLMEVEFDLAITLDTIRLHLFSQGLFLVIFRQLQMILSVTKEWFQKRRQQQQQQQQQQRFPTNNNSAEMGVQIPQEIVTPSFDDISILGGLSQSGESTSSTFTTSTRSLNTRASSSPFYMLNKIIGGVEIHGLTISSRAIFRENDAGSARTRTCTRSNEDSSSADKDASDEHANLPADRSRTTLTRDNTCATWSLQIKKVFATLETLKDEDSGTAVHTGQSTLSMGIERLATSLVVQKEKEVVANKGGAKNNPGHCIIIRSLQAAISIHSDDDDMSKKHASIRIEDSVTEETKGGVVEILSSYEQILNLSQLAEWVRPMIDMVQLMKEKSMISRLQLQSRQNGHGQKKKKERRARSNSNPNSFVVDDVYINAGAVVSLKNDGLVYPESCNSERERDSTSLNHIRGIQIGSRIQVTKSQSRMHLMLSETFVIQLSNSSYKEEEFSNILNLDRFELDTSIVQLENGLDTAQSDIGNSSHSQQYVSTEQEIIIGNLEIGMDEGECTENILLLILYSLQAVSSMAPAKHTKEGKGSGEKHRTRTGTPKISISLETCDVNVALRSKEKGEWSSPVVFSAKANSFSMNILPRLNQDKDISLRVSHIEASTIFLPHRALPTYNRCVEELGIGMKSEEIPDSDKNVDKMAQFQVTASDLSVSVASSSALQTQGIVVQVSDIVLKEFFNYSLRDGSFCYANDLLSINGELEVAIKKSSKEPYILQSIDVQTRGAKLQIMWSTAIQWFIFSVIKRSENLFEFYMAKILSKKKLKSKKKQVLTTVHVEVNQTIVQVRAILSGGSIVDLLVRDIIVSVTKDLTATWDKPDITFNSGRTELNLNESNYTVASFDSVRYFNGIRRATKDEIDSYCAKRLSTIELREEIVTARCGAPIVELVDIRAGENTTIDLPPLLHLGKIIEDINNTVSGLQKSRLTRPREKEKKKYQLMDISMTIPTLNANFLENDDRKVGVLRHLGRYAMHRDGLLNRWKFYLKGFDVKIKRHTPPDVTQNQIRKMDEDTSRLFAYGPMIQGGVFDIHIKRVINTLHPLNLATPLGDITNWQIKGLIYLAPLSPEMKGLVGGKEFCVPVKCHHSNSQSLKSSNTQCSCDHATINTSRNIPVKIYHDLAISSDEVHSTYGDILMPSISPLMNIIQRLIPKPPLIDPREIQIVNETPDLDWWDNLRFQFHGSLKWSMEKMSFRWLLDSATRYDWAIFLTSKKFVLSYSTGLASLEMDSAVISLPDLSYHMLEIKPPHSACQILSQYFDTSKPGFRPKRHPLVLFPTFRTQFSFNWEVSSSLGNHSSNHHNVYIIDDSSIDASGSDRFEHFRSNGWEILWNFQLSRDPLYSPWIALRGDVLPWITHKSPRIGSDPSAENEGPDPLPKVNGIKVNVDISPLNIGVWFDERSDTQTPVPDSALEGIYLQVPQLTYDLSCGKHCIDLSGNIHAALLELTSNKSTSLETKTTLLPEFKWLPKHYPGSFAEINNKHSLSLFDTLQLSTKQTRSLDYLLTVDQIKIMDKALDDVKRKPDQDSLQDDDDFFEIESKKREAPWTVLVAGMRLLWTVEIRDSVVAIVKDVLFAINFMQVNSRGTPQLLESEPKNNVNIDNTSQTMEDATDEEAVNTSDQTDHHHIDIVPIELSHDDKPKSHLDYLLSQNEEVEHKPSTISSPSVSSPTVRSSNPEFSTGGAFGSTSKGRDSAPLLDETIPTFDLHLSNPQIQFHSETTGGSIIIGICGAYIEGHKYANLFATDKVIENDDLGLETLLRRTNFIYTLDRLQLFSISNNVDVDVGLQWLHYDERGAKGNEEVYSKKECDEIDDSTLAINDSLESLSLGEKSLPEVSIAPVQEDQYKTRIMSERSAMFPKELEIFDTREFGLPSLCELIMEPSTFKTRQEFHRPPIDLTKEELAEVIDQNLVSPFLASSEKSLAIDSIEMFLDELSFNLDSGQFSTTLDVIRNVILEPMKPRQERYYQVKDKQINSITDCEEGSKSAENSTKPLEQFQLEKALNQLREGSHKNAKRCRENLRSLANSFLADIEENQLTKNGPSSRRIEYMLCKAKWKIAGPDTNDAEINFTGFKGIHDFKADGSVNSQISLEDLHITSGKYSEDAKEFDDPSIIVKTALGVDLSPCQRCGLNFNRSTNEVHSCAFHPGKYQGYGEGSAMFWSCCQATDKSARGCKSRPHTGRERAVALQFDALPRKIDGLTMYKILEGNMYPGMPYKIIVQLTKSTVKSFMKYFLGSPDDVTKGLSGGESSESLGSNLNPGIALVERDGEPSARKFLLFGSRNSKAGNENRNTSLTALGENSDSDKKKETPKGEICFLKNWRLGDLNICLSVAGFGKVVDLSDLNLVVSSFQRAYKIGSADYLARKLIAHLLKSVVLNSHELLKVKFGGKGMKQGSDQRSALQALEDGDESDEEAADLLFTHTITKKKRKRLFGHKNRN